jgi:hypothetical protein
MIGTLRARSTSGDTSEHMAGTAPDMSRLGLGLIAMAVMLALTILAMGAVGRFLGPSHPRRAIAVRVVLWIGTAVLILILLQLRQ